MTIITRLASAFAARPRRTRKVVDTNCLQSEALRAYLSASAHNYVILTNYAAMEAYKGDTLKSIYRSMEKGARTALAASQLYVVGSIPIARSNNFNDLWSHRVSAQKRKLAHS